MSLNNANWQRKKPRKKMRVLNRMKKMKIRLQTMSQKNLKISHKLLRKTIPKRLKIPMLTLQNLRMRTRKLKKPKKNKKRLLMKIPSNWTTMIWIGMMTRKVEKGKRVKVRTKKEVLRPLKINLIKPNPNLLIIKKKAGKRNREGRRRLSAGS